MNDKIPTWPAIGCHLPLLLIGLLAWPCRPLLADPVPTALARPGPWQPRQQALGRVTPEREATLGLPFAARITSPVVEIGTRVRKGQVLMRFKSPTLAGHLTSWRQAGKEQALARRDLALLRAGGKTHTVTRHDRLQGEQALTRREGATRLAWQVLAADLLGLNIETDADSLSRRLQRVGRQEILSDLSRLLAPFDGLVTERRVSPGAQVAAGTPILRLEALQSVYVDVEVGERALTTWRSGGKTRWRSATGWIELQPAAGRPVYDADSGLWRLRFRSRNPGLALRRGRWLEVEHLGPARTVYWVPDAAVVARNGRTWCVIERDGHFASVEVEAGPASDGRTPILSGLGAGDQVVTEGAYERLYHDIKGLIRFVD